MNQVTTLITGSELQKIVDQTPHSKNHKRLIKAFQAQFPTYEFHLMSEEGDWTTLDGRLLDADNNEISPSWREWLKIQFEACADDPRATLDFVKQKQYRMTTDHGKYLHIAVKTGNTSADFIQITIESIQYEEIKAPLFGDALPYALDDYRDLLNLAEERDYSLDPVAIENSARYGTVSMTHTAQHLKLAIECNRAEKEHHVKTMTFNVKQGELMSTQTRADDGRGEYTMLDLHPDYLDHEIEIKRHCCPVNSHSMTS